MHNCKIKLEVVWTTSVWPKGQIVVPKNLRDKLNINPWDKMVVLLKDDKYIWLVRNDDMKGITEFVSSKK
jgi:AbrB family looped-hinge helix DNA binding protein